MMYFQTTFSWKGSTTFSTNMILDIIMETKCVPLQVTWLRCLIWALFTFKFLGTLLWHDDWNKTLIPNIKQQLRQSQLIQLAYLKPFGWSPITCDQWKPQLKITFWIRGKFSSEKNRKDMVQVLSRIAIMLIRFGEKVNNVFSSAMNHV